MEKEILYLDTEYKQIIFEKHRYQKNEKKSSWYRSNITIHLYPTVDAYNVPLMDAYNRQYQKLTEKYSYNEIAEYWKPFTTVKSNLRYHRNQTKPNNPKQTKDIQINEIYSTINCEQFLQFDNKDNKNQILIFMFPIGMKILCNSVRWHFDGTFKTCLTYFLQIISFHGYYQNQMHPACYILLQNKERETYVEALSNLKEIFTRNNCSIVLQETLSFLNKKF
ncbi:hypothetical protein BpHYR1_015621 [Brachionus plicatilis]|uniref:Uncharacterized protein n=1 Tax=Brachionus plicatilis TaxID=10195 RepID=A0A3M7RHY2_BRAPC|nr:hypothetical protein BpHYR1_015621 [Brachionus plicatilis]